MILKIRLFLQPFTGLFELFYLEVSLPNTLEGPFPTVIELLFTKDNPRSVFVKEFPLKLTFFFIIQLERRDSAEIPWSCL